MTCGSFHFFRNARLVSRRALQYIHVDACSSAIQRPSFIMSIATPGTSAPTPEGGTPTPASQDGVNDSTAIDKLVLEYLRSRGHKSAEKALADAMDTGVPAAEGTSMTASEFISKLAVHAKSALNPTENALKDAASVLQELGALGNSPPNIQDLISSIGPVGAEEILSTDPMDKQQGFRELEAWVDGSLDMYRVRMCTC